jgi:methionyl-tRNA synthetase
MSQLRKIIATSALPYANGSIHLGHLVEYLQTDFFVRFQKMRGHQAIYICADDTHGTPIMIRARSEGINPEELIARSQKEHVQDFENFQIQFDHYSSTHSPENRQMAERIFKSMEDGGHIKIKSVKQAYCEHDQMFLPDRFVRGTCPNCGSLDQYGDSCDKCGATYSPTEVKDPRCSICGNTPIEKDSDHLFFQLNDFKDFLKDWVPQHTQKEVANKMSEWLEGDLRAWDISRDAPYFGFEIPGHPGKYFYVWVDAPVGYLSSTMQWCEQQGLDFDSFWNDPETEIFHFIGKDIVYFHVLFWPAMLKAAGIQRPSQVFVHGFLTVNGEKMSKSKGTFISAQKYLEYLDPTHLRYYYACKLNGIGDIDLNFEDFASRVNSDLIGKITNLGSRGAQMINKKFSGELSQISAEGRALIDMARKKSDLIAQLYESLNFAKAIVEIRSIADEANRYFDEKAPWKLIKDDPEATQSILTDIVNIFMILTTYLKPVMPEYAQKVEELLKTGELQWSSVDLSLENMSLNPFEHLSQRVDLKKIEELVEASKA